MVENEQAATPADGAGEGATITEGEAPEALFDLDIGDAEVDFVLEGVWRASVFGSIGAYDFPDLNGGWVFEQNPDLTFSIWLLNRFFVEASVIGDFSITNETQIDELLEQDYNYWDQNYILMGYLGQEEEFLKRILIGSKDVSIDPFPFIDVPEPGLSSLGVEAVMGTGMSEHQLLLRYDNNEPDSLTYLGSNLVSEQVFALDEYIRGRFFKLPDGNVDDLEVYIEDEFGPYNGDDGNNYRKADSDDAVVDSAEGTVFLTEAAEGSVLVYYSKSGTEVGDDPNYTVVDAFPFQVSGKLDVDPASEPEDFNWSLNYLGQAMSTRRVTLTPSTRTHPYLRLYKPDEFSPFEILSSYEIEEPVPEDLTRFRVSIVNKADRNREASSPIEFRLTPEEEYITAYVDPDLRDDLRNLYPFLDDYEASPIFDDANLLYGPLADAKPGYLDYEILVSELTPVSVYQVGSDVVPGSVQILRNGITETRFEVDYELGTITFFTEIAEDDRLVVSFRRKESQVNNGDILFAWGNTLSFGEALNLQLATGVRWNFLSGSFSEETYSRTGSVLASAGLNGTIGPLTYEASLGGAYTNPDTTGVLRLLSMEQDVAEPPESPFYLTTTSFADGDVVVEMIEEIDTIPPIDVDVEDELENLVSDPDFTYQELADAYSDDPDFHPFGEQQRVLKVYWNNTGGADGSWMVQNYTDVDNQDVAYRNIVFYYLVSTEPGNVINTTSVLQFELLDMNDQGVRWSIQMLAGNRTNLWRKITVSLEDEVAYAGNGTPVAGSSVTIDPVYGSFDQFSVKMTDIDAGNTATLYLDELHLTEPRGALGAAATLDLELMLPGAVLAVGDYALIHDLALRESASFSSRGFSTLYGRPAQTRSMRSATELGLGLAFADLGIDFAVAANNESVALTVGHDLTIPNVSFPLVFSEAFRLSGPTTDPLTIEEFPQFSREQTEIQRANTLSLSASPFARLDLSAAAGTIENVLSQSWAADLSLTPGPVSLQNNLSVSGSVDGFVLPPGGYFANWINGYALLVPYNTLAGFATNDYWEPGLELERRADVTMDWSAVTLPVGVQAVWLHAFHSYDYDLPATTGTLKSTAQMELSLPIRWQKGGVNVFSITPGYRRDLDVVNRETGLLDFSDDIPRSFETIYNQSYLYNQLPFAELYSVESEQLFMDLSEFYGLDKADYSAEVYIQLSRRFSSRIRDLFLPSFFELGLKKNFVKNEDLTDLYNTYTLEARSTALNLFGAFGAYPLFAFYRTDEFTTSVSVSLDVLTYTGGATLGDWQAAQPSQATVKSAELIWDHFFSFEGQDDNALTFENRLNLLYDWASDEVYAEYGRKWGWGETVKLLYNWSRYPETGVRLPLIPEDVGKEGHWSHQDSLIVEIKGPGEQISYYPLNLLVSHESTAVLPEFGEISAEISVGCDMEKISAADRGDWHSGLRGGISVEIEF